MGEINKPRIGGDFNSPFFTTDRTNRQRYQQKYKTFERYLKELDLIYIH